MSNGLTDKDGNPVLMPDEKGTVVETKPSVEQKLADFINWGRINFESDKGIVHSNCKAFSFNSAHELNKWFEDNDGMFATQIFGVRDYIVAIIDRVQDPEVQQYLEDKADIMDGLMREKRDERAKATELQKEADEKAKAEVERLMENGRKYDRTHDALVKEIEGLKLKVKELKKAAKK